MDWSAIENDIARATGDTFKVELHRDVGGGCINKTFVLEGESRRFFVKQNSPEQHDMFAAEAAGLREIRDSNCVRVPEPVCHATDGRVSWLVMEYMELEPPRPVTAISLGEKLAAMHRHCVSRFGWHRDNTIGATPQVNTPGQDWSVFFRDNRLRPQLALAARNGADVTMLDRGNVLAERMAGLFDGYTPEASLLHGDLWGGNWGSDLQGQPVLFDPATYYGDRETDLAMSELFGGFDDRFYQSYRQSWAIDSGYATRKVLYNLYHVLNHFNLFGPAYAAQAQDMIDRLIAELG